MYVCLFIYLFIFDNSRKSEVRPSHKKEAANESSETTSKNRDEKKVKSVNSNYKTLSKISVKHLYPRKEKFLKLFHKK